MRLSKFSRKLVAYLCAIAMVVSSFVFTPSTDVNAAQSETVDGITYTVTDGAQGDWTGIVTQGIFDKARIHWAWGKAVDPASITITVDGKEVTALGTNANGVHVTIASVKEAVNSQMGNYTIKITAVSTESEELMWTADLKMEEAAPTTTGEPGVVTWVDIPNSDGLQYDDSTTAKVINVQQPGWSGLTQAGVYVEPPSGAGAPTSVSINGEETAVVQGDNGTFFVQGAGILYYLTSLTAATTTIEVEYAAYGSSTLVIKNTKAEETTEAPTEAPTEETEAPTEAPTEETEVPTEAPTEETTEAPTEAPTEETTEAPSEETTEAPTEETTEVPTEETTEAPTVVPGEFTPLEPGKFPVVEEQVEEGQVVGRWFQVAGYEVYLGYWDSASGQAMIDATDPDTIKFQQLTSNFWDAWGTQVRKTVSGLNAGEEYTLTLTLNGSKADGTYKTSSNDDLVSIQAGDQTVTITATANESGVATFVVGTGFIGTSVEMGYSDVVVKDKDGKQVYPSEEPTTEEPTEESTEAPTESPTVEPSTEAPSEVTTEAPTAEPTTQAPTEKPTVVPTTSKKAPETTTTKKTKPTTKKVKKPGKAKVKKAIKKKKSAKKIKVTLKKVKRAKGYQVAVYKSKKKAKKNKKALVKKFTKKLKFTLKSKKFKNKKKLYVKARAYVLKGRKKVYGKWSKTKKVKIKKKKKKK